MLGSPFFAKNKGKHNEIQTINPERTIPYSTLLKKGWKQKEIAESIGVHPSTISREIRRNWDYAADAYDYSTAYLNTKTRHQNKIKNTVINHHTER